ncbi:MAG: hypothetical protein IKM04_02960 [Clostridia bacterium]|nr:hypothetical protein [Clostridia bacterium]
MENSFCEVGTPIVLEGEHWTVTAIKLNALTDEIDTLVNKNTYHLFKGRVAQKVS